MRGGATELEESGDQLMESVKRVSIIGASGFIGRYLVDHLRSIWGIRLKLLIHNNVFASWQNDPRIELISGDLLEANTLSEAVRDTNTLVILTYLKGAFLQDNQRALKNILDAAICAKVERIIFLSTAILVGKTRTKDIDEDSAPCPKSEYEMTKWRLERLFLSRMKEAGFENWTILRPTAIFGPHGSNLVKLIEDERRGPLSFRTIRALIFQKRNMNLVSIGRVISGITFFVLREKANRGIFIISNDDDERNNYRYFSLLVEDCFGLPSITRFDVPFMGKALKCLLSIMSRSPYDPARRYLNKKMTDLGWKYDVPLSEELKEYLIWYRDR